jgi:hypothetical protein
MCVGGFTITCDAIVYQYTIGDTVLIPAAVQSYVLAEKLQF